MTGSCDSKATQTVHKPSLQQRRAHRRCDGLDLGSPGREAKSLSQRTVTQGTSKPNLNAGPSDPNNPNRGILLENNP